jgi:ribonuclease HII
MARAVAALPVAAQHVLVDGNRCPKVQCSVEAVVGGDATVEAIGAASILAKVARDQEMATLDIAYPGYGFAQHKGYPTKAHIEALSRLGVTDIHRRSFAPVKRLLQE